MHRATITLYGNKYEAGGGLPPGAPPFPQANALSDNAVLRLLCGLPRVSSGTVRAQLARRTHTCRAPLATHEAPPGRLQRHYVGSR